MEEYDGRRWSDFEVGSRGERTFLRLYDRLPDAELYRSDGLQVYRSWLPADRHRVGKGGAVNWNEEPAPGLNRGLHSFLRGKLNRLGRKPKGYSKREGALRDGLTLVWVCHGLI